MHEGESELHVIVNWIVNWIWIWQEYRVKTIDPIDGSVSTKINDYSTYHLLHVNYILTRKLVPLMQSYVRSYVHAHVRTHVGRTHTRRFWSSLIDCVRITLTRACVLSNSRFFLSTIIENVGINQIRNTPTNIYDIFVSHAAISHLFSTFFHSLTTFHAF